MNAIHKIPQEQPVSELTLDSEDLFGPASVLTILHNGMAYTISLSLS